jgi:hypothetical protein
MTMNQNEFPEGWNEDSVKKLLAFYSEQTDDQAVAEDEAGVESGDTVMNVTSVSKGKNPLSR